MTGKKKASAKQKSLGSKRSGASSAAIGKKTSRNGSGAAKSRVAATKLVSKQNAVVVEDFVQIVKSFSYQQGGRFIPLRNITFWAGAGFSKAWDENSPIGNQLFSIPKDFVEEVFGPLNLGRMFGIGIDADESISIDDIKRIVYYLDMNEKYPDIRHRYLDAQNIRVLKGMIASMVLENFKRLCPLGYFGDDNKFPPLATKSQKEVVEFFKYLWAQADGSKLIAEGLRFHFVTTNYDFIIEQILDNLNGPDDSLFLYAYRGFTPRIIANRQNIQPLHEHWLAQSFIKLNGGFEIVPSGTDYELQYSPRDEGEVRDNPPILIFPSREQDYTHPYFQTIFPKTVRLMRDSNVLVIVGYSLPEEDALIRFILRQFAEDPEDAVGKFIFYIDMNDNQVKRQRVAELFPSLDDDWPKLRTYQGSFGSFVAECNKLLADAVRQGDLAPYIG